MKKVPFLITSALLLASILASCAPESVDGDPFAGLNFNPNTGGEASSSSDNWDKPSSSSSLDKPSSSSSWNNPPSSSSEPMQKQPIGYCDYGYPYTDGGSCYPVYSRDDCYEEYFQEGGFYIGVFAQQCGRTDITYCARPRGNSSNPSPIDTDCYPIAKGNEEECIGYGGHLYSVCPRNSLSKQFFCWWPTNEWGEGGCYAIDGDVRDVHECAASYGAIVYEDFCHRR